MPYMANPRVSSSQLPHCAGWEMGFLILSFSSFLGGLYDLGELAAYALPRMVLPRDFFSLTSLGTIGSRFPFS